MKGRITKLIRVATVAPIPALILCSVLYANGEFYSLLDYGMAVLFLALLPLLAYPVAALIPALHKRGRGAERPLAIAFSVAGYVGGMVFALCRPCVYEPVLYGTYLLSGILIALCSFVFHFRASGHTCGVAGPIAMLIWRVSPFWLFSLPVLMVVVWASLSMKRHTLPQLLAGSVIPVAAMAVSSLIFL